MFWYSNEVYHHVQYFVGNVSLWLFSVTIKDQIRRVASG